MASKIRDAMAKTMWTAVWEYTHRRTESKPKTVPSEVERATRDLEKLYETANGVMSLDTLWQRALDATRDQRPRVDLDEASFGEWLVWAALGDAHAEWRRIPVIKVPSFELKVQVSKSGVIDFTWDGDSDQLRARVRAVQGRARRNPCHGNPSQTRSLAEVRDILASLPADQRCHPTCQGWEVFTVDREPGVEIEVCDECNRERPKDQRLMDDDVEQLPEAQLALAKEFERGDEDGEDVEELHENPSGRFYVFYLAGGRKLPKQYWGPFDRKAEADAAKRDEVKKYGESPQSRYVVKQLDDAAFRKVWGGAYAPKDNPGRLNVGDRVRIHRGVPHWGGTEGYVVYLPHRGGAHGTDDHRMDQVQVGEHADGGGFWVPKKDVTRIGMGRPPGVPNPRRRGGNDPTKVGDRVKVMWDEGDWYGIVERIEHGPTGGTDLRVRADGDYPHPGVSRGSEHKVKDRDATVRPKLNPDIEDDLGINPRGRAR